MLHKNYEKFKGKVCTILIPPVSFPFRDPRQYAQFFSGEVTEVNVYGIFIRNVESGVNGFFTFPILGIVEEVVVKNTDPEYKKIKEELDKKNRPAVMQPVTLTIEEMTKKAQQIKSERANTIS